MGLRDKYAYAIQTAKGKFQGNAEERDGKLYFKGTVATDAERNELWTAIKTIPDWQSEVVAVLWNPQPSTLARPARRNLIAPDPGSSGLGGRILLGDDLGYRRAVVRPGRPVVVDQAPEAEVGHVVEVGERAQRRVLVDVHGDRADLFTELEGSVCEWLHVGTDGNDERVHLVAHVVRPLMNALPHPFQEPL